MASYSRRKPQVSEEVEGYPAWSYGMASIGPVNGELEAEVLKRGGTGEGFCVRGLTWRQIRRNAVERLEARS